MSDDLFQNKYRIESARANWHDYNGGSYFITICTKHREHFFGKIKNGEMMLSDIGKYTQQCIKEIKQHNPYAEIPQSVIMPNHVHLIVIITAPNGRDVPWRVSTTGKNETMQNIANRQGRLSTAIAGFKQTVTRYANKNEIPFSWQPRFHDHIIRDTPEMNRIADYIENNVANWVNDEFYTP
jgi:REP element-mobilizing transposase RayT